MPADDAAMMAQMDTMVKEGAEDRLNDVVQTLTGIPPLSFREFASREKHVWIQEAV